MGFPGEHFESDSGACGVCECDVCNTLYPLFDVWIENDKTILRETYWHPEKSKFTSPAAWRKRDRLIEKFLDTQTKDFNELREVPELPLHKCRGPMNCYRRRMAADEYDSMTLLIGFPCFFALLVMY